MLKVGILDPREIWSTGVSLVVEQCGFQVIGRWPSAVVAAPALRSSPPDILFASVDLLRELCGTDCAFAMKPPGIILVAEQADLPTEPLPDLPFEGLVFRDVSLVSVKACLKAVAAGHAWLDPAIFQVIARKIGPSTGWTGLSRRQLEVANLAAGGLSNKRIARVLNLSDGTVKMHMHHILAKLDVAGREQLGAGFAAATGSVPLGSEASAEDRPRSALSAAL